MVWYLSNNSSFLRNHEYDCKSLKTKIDNQHQIEIDFMQFNVFLVKKKKIEWKTNEKPILVLMGLIKPVIQ